MLCRDDPLSAHDQTSARFYDRDATSYDESRWKSPGGGATRRAQGELFNDLIAGWRGSGAVLEVGSGTGRFSVLLARRASRIVLADLSLEMLRRASAVVSAEGVHAPTVQASLAALPLRYRTFDYAVCVNVLNHVESLEAGLDALAETVMEGGEVVFNFANRRGLYWPVAAYITRRRRAIGRPVPSRWDSRPEVEAACVRAGLVVVERRGHLHAPRPLDRVVPAAVIRFVNGRLPAPLLLRLSSFVFLRCTVVGRADSS